MSDSGNSIRRKATIAAIHCIAVFAILMISADAVAVEGEFARKLSLPGSAVIVFVPFVAVGIYASAAILMRRASNRWGQIAGFVAAYSLVCICAAYPHWIFARYSKMIEMRSFFGNDTSFLPTERIKSFEQRFATPALQYSSTSTKGTVVIVPRDKFTPAMVSFLKEQADQSMHNPR